MNKKLKKRLSKKKLIIVLAGGIISVASMLTVFKIGFIYANNKEENVRDEKLLGNTISEMIYNTSQEIQKGPSESFGKVAYITIDDGPSKYTDEIIRTLNKYNAKATFFMIDSNMKNHPQQVNNIIENGNTPGLHSVSHDIHKLYANEYSAKEEFDISSKTFFNITGKYSKVIRLPYGSKPYTPKKSYEKLVEAGYKMWDWDIDTQDWRATSNQIVDNVVTYSKNQDDIVILMHEKRQTLESLDTILKYLTQEGYELLPIDENQEPQNYWLENLK